jgi:DNA-binding response OmpR family regulator
MTAGAMKQDREECMAAGMDDYIAKPVDLVSVRTALQKWVEADQPVPPPALDSQRLEDRRQWHPRPAAT